MSLSKERGSAARSMGMYIASMQQRRDPRTPAQRAEIPLNTSPSTLDSGNGVGTYAPGISQGLIIPSMTPRPRPLPSPRPQPKTLRGLAVSRFWSGVVPTSQGLVIPSMTPTLPTSQGLPIPSMERQVPRSKGLAILSMLRHVDPPKLMKPKAPEGSVKGDVERHWYDKPLAVLDQGADAVTGAVTSAPGKFLDSTKEAVTSSPGWWLVDKGMDVAGSVAVGRVSGWLDVFDRLGQRITESPLLTRAQQNFRYLGRWLSTSPKALEQFAGGALRQVDRFGRYAGAAGKLFAPVGAAVGVVSALDTYRKWKQGDATDQELIESGLSIVPYLGTAIFLKNEAKAAVGAKAKGGRVRSDEMTLVGERGPEVVQLPGGSDAMAARRARQLAGAGARRSRGDVHVRQHLDGREITRSTVRNLDDDEQWGWR